MARQPAGEPLPPGVALDEAQRLLDAGLPFHAHEVLEDRWKAAPEPERALWRGLAQLAVGLTHAGRGNAVGASALLRRGAAGIETFARRAPYGLDIAGVLRWAEDLADRLATHPEPVDVASAAPHLRSELRHPPPGTRANP